MPSKKSRLRLYADECFPVPTVTYLRAKGISIVHAFDTNNVRKNDKFHLKESKKLGRILITLDRDFLYYETASLKNYPGVIVISTGSPTPPSINSICDKVLKILNTDYIRGASIKITRDKVIKVKEGIKTSKPI